MDFIIPILRTYFLFSIFILQISLFGGIFVYVIIKSLKIEKKLSLFEYFIISFLLGFLLFILISYIFIILNFYNFYTIYLPLIILSSVFLIFLYVKYYSFERLKILLKNKKIYHEISFFSMVFFLQIIIISPIILKNLSLFSVDPYYWTKTVLYLIEKGDLLNNNPKYPFGFTVFNSGVNLISPEIRSVYFFMKFACLPGLSFCLIIMYSISRKAFNEKILMVLTLIGIFGSSYFLFRTTLYLSSFISVVMSLVMMYTLISKIPNFFIGLIIPIMFLTNPIYCFYVIIAVVLFYLIKLTYYSFKRAKKKFVFSLKNFLFIALFSFLFIEIYFLFYQLETGINQFEIIYSYFELILQKVKIYSANLSVIHISFDSIKIMGDTLPRLLIYDDSFFKFLIPLIIIGTILFVRKSKELNENFWLFLFIGFSLFIFFGLFLHENIENGYFSQFGIRIIEIFWPYVLILFLKMVELFLWEFKGIINSFNTKIRKFVSRMKKHKKNIKSKYHFDLKIIVLAFILIGIVHNSISIGTNYRHEYRYNGTLEKCVFYIDQNVDEDQPILARKYDDWYIFTPYDLIYEYNLIYYPWLRSISLSDFFDNYIKEYNCSYLVINFDHFSEEFVNDFLSNDSFIELVGGNNYTDWRFYEIIEF